MTDRIQEETILMPYVIADCVVAELEHFFYARGLGNLDNRRELADALVARAEGCYAHNERVRRAIKRASGREWLYCFMRHWLAAEIHKSSWRLFREIPHCFMNGQPIVR